MKTLPNIEPSRFRRGQYVGYYDGCWIIMRSAGGWYARHSEFKYPGFHARTLREVSQRLEGMK